MSCQREPYRSTLEHMKFPDIALASLATLRLTRFVTTDKLGDWWAVQPVKRWATEREGGIFEGYGVQGGDVLAAPEKVRREHRETLERAEPDPDLGWRSKLADGLECPFCVGFWIGAATLSTAVVCQRSRTAQATFRLVAGSLGMNYVTGHIGSRLD